MLLPNNADDITLLRDIRSMLAKHETDIQRLWRLTERTHHEPFFVIGGDAGESSGASFPDASSATGIEDDDNTDSPGGGPTPGGVDQDCCLWIWDGAEWRKVIDNTIACTCPEPTNPGTVIGEFAVTCCESSSMVSSNSACVVSCHGCDIPCEIEITVSGDSGNELYNGFNGTHTLFWNNGEGGVNKWVSACIPVSLVGGLVTGLKIEATCTSGTCGGSPFDFAVAYVWYAGGSCTTLGDTFAPYCPVDFTCDPLMIEYDNAPGIGQTSIITAS